MRDENEKRQSSWNLGVGAFAVGLCTMLVNVGCSVNPEVQEVRALPGILCPGDSTQVDTIYRNVEELTMTFTPGRSVSLPSAEGALTLNGVNEGPICEDTIVESTGVLGERTDSATAAIEVIDGEQSIPLEFSAMCRCIDRTASDFRGYAPREVDRRIYSDSLLVRGVRNDSAYTVALSHEGISDSAASGDPFPAFTAPGIPLVGQWVANPTLLPAPGTRFDCCADPAGPLEPTPPGEGIRRVGYPRITVQVVTGCEEPDDGVCSP